MRSQNPADAMNERTPQVAPPTQASMGTPTVGVIRNAINGNIQPDDNGVIAPFKFSPPGGVSGWKRVRISNYSPYAMQIIGIPGGGSGDPPQILQPYQQNVWPYYASRGTITCVPSFEGSPLAVPPLRFAYGAGTAKDALLFNFVTIEWTDVPELFFGYYPVPLTGIAITAEAMQTSPLPVMIPVGADPLELAVHDGLNRIYVANHSDDTVSVIDGNTNNVIATVPVGVGPQGITVDVATNKVYVACNGDSMIKVIDCTSNVVTASIGPLAAAPWDITCNPITGKKFVTIATGNVVVLSPADAVVATTAVGNVPQGITVDTSSDLVYVCNSGDNTVNVIDGATNLVVGPAIPTGNGPGSVTVDAVKNLIYVSNNLANNVTVINGLTATVLTTIAVGTAPIGINANGVSEKVYVANNVSDSVSVIDENSQTVVNTLSPGVGPRYVAVNPVTNRVYVTIAADAVIVLQGAP